MYVALHIDAAGIDHEIEPILEIFPDRVRLQPLDVQLAVRLDRLDRQVPVPFDRARRAWMSPVKVNRPPATPVVKSLQLEIDRLQSRGELGRAALDPR